MCRTRSFIKLWNLYNIPILCYKCVSLNFIYPITANKNISQFWNHILIINISLNSVSTLIKYHIIFQLKLLEFLHANAYHLNFSCLRLQENQENTIAIWKISKSEYNNKRSYYIRVVKKCTLVVCRKLGSCIYKMQYILYILYIQWIAMFTSPRNIYSFWLYVVHNKYP